MKTRDKLGKFTGNPKVKILCQNCPAVIFEHPSQKRRFCSSMCAVSYLKPVPPLQLGKTWKLSPETVRRQVVAAQLRNANMTEAEKLNRVERIRTGLSSPDVREKMSVWQRGEKHYKWMDGRTGVTKRIRKSYKYREWRTSVFTRDNYQCVICMERGGSLEADHYPTGFAEIITSENIKSIEQGLVCEKLWDIGNGRTLCKKCHRGPNAV